KGIKADLIIVGAHGAHGIKKLIGSTAQSVLNNSTCDVLAVRKS
ncbi:MAG: universal stress protein, partial [Gammaproteobacteria bacterium]|nr:universal stress protein [Gammaproteobacteria bacterium]